MRKRTARNARSIALAPATGTTAFLRAKFHGIRVTGADLDYEGSILLDPVQCQQAGILPFEFVDVWNKTNGQRLSTYVIFGEPDSRCCVLNGAAARLCQVGDELIIAARIHVPIAQVADLKPVVLEFRPDNRVKAVRVYSVSRDVTGSLTVASRVRRAGAQSGRRRRG